MGNQKIGRTAQVSQVCSDPAVACFPTQESAEGTAGTALLKCGPVTFQPFGQDQGGACILGHLGAGS